MISCHRCGADTSAPRAHNDWHDALELQITLLQSIVEAQMKRIQKLESEQ